MYQTMFILCFVMCHSHLHIRLNLNSTYSIFAPLNGSNSISHIINYAQLYVTLLDKIRIQVFLQPLWHHGLNWVHPLLLTSLVTWHFTLMMHWWSFAFVHFVNKTHHTHKAGYNVFTILLSWRNSHIVWGKQHHNAPLYITHMGKA